MPITVTCDCGRKLQVRDEFGGEQGKCPSCGRTFTIPFSEEPVSVPRAGSVSEPDESEAPSPSSSEEGEPLRNHGDGAIPADADFFADAPEEIGPVTSAYTTLRSHKQPMSAGARLIVCGSVGLLGLVVGALIDGFFEVRNEFFQLFWPGGGGLLAAAGTWYWTRFKHTCTYVGKQGTAHFVCSGSRDNLTTQDVFLFRDAAEIRTTQTSHSTNGVYTHTTFSFQWSDVGGRPRYTISGQYKASDGNPPTKDFYHFGRAAEIAWTVYLLEGVFRQIELSGTVLFHLTGGQWVRLGPGLVILGLSREPLECPADELAGSSVSKGVVTIQRRDAKKGWFSSSGVYTFNYANLGNAQLFLLMMERVVGIPVG